MAAIDDNPQPFECQAARKRSLRLLDISAQSVINTHRFANMVGSWANVFDFTAKHEAFDFKLDFVVELVAIGTKKFDSVIGVRVVGSRNHQPGIGSKTSRDVGDSRCRQWSDEQ